MPAIHRTRYSLRAFLVAVTIVSLFIGYQLNWIRQRHSVLQDERIFQSHSLSGENPSAPSFLWVFGEKGVVGIDEIENKTERRKRLTSDEKNRVERLFPEAFIFWND